MLRPASWTGPAGVSPVPVGAAAPGSRPRFVGEIRRAERGVQSLAARVDRLTLEAVEAYGVRRMLDDLAADRPAPVRRREVPKPDGRKRPLGIPTVRDRVAQQAAKLVLEPVFEADIRDSFGAFDRAWAGHRTGELVRDADDVVVLCRSASEAEETRCRAAALLGDLVWHPDKTRVVDLRQGREGFDFLGCHLRAGMSGTLWEQKRIVRYSLHRWPSARSMKRATDPGQGPHRSVSGRDAAGGRHHPSTEGGVTMSKGPSVSRVRENRTRGLKGGWGNRAATRFPAPLTTNGRRRG